MSHVDYSENADHNDPSIAQQQPVRVSRFATDHLKLIISTFDTTYQRRTNCTCHVKLPAEKLDQAALEAYLNDAYAIFEPILDNELTLKLSYQYQGAGLILERQRLHGYPALSAFCYRFRISMRTEKGFSHVVALSSIRPILPSGHNIRAYPLIGTTPVAEIRALYDFIQRPDFPWITPRGERMLFIEKGVFRNDGSNSRR